MKTTHTAGEWKKIIQPAPHGLTTTINVGSQRICEIWHTTIDETEANAKLIAAAPDLLKAIQLLKELLDENLPNWYLRKHFRMSEEAITKATS